MHCGKGKDFQWPTGAFLLIGVNRHNYYIFILFIIKPVPIHIASVS